MSDKLFSSAFGDWEKDASLRAYFLLNDFSRRFRRELSDSQRRMLSEDTFRARRGLEGDREGILRWTKKREVNNGVGTEEKEKVVLTGYDKDNVRRWEIRKTGKMFSFAYYSDFAVFEKKKRQILPNAAVVEFSKRPLPSEKSKEREGQVLLKRRNGYER